MPGQFLAFGPFIFDCRRGTLFRGASPVVIGRRERALLQALLEARGEVVTKSSLMDAAWPKTNVEESNLTVQIAALRRSIGQSATGENWIATIPGVGYRLVHSTPVRQRDVAAVEAPAALDEIEPRPTIAVLPFTNMSSDPEQEYFGDGLAEDLITDLSRIPGFVVIARHSSFAYKGKPVDIRTIAKDLGVRYVIEGSVRRDADRIRISAQIIDAIGNVHLWASRFDRELESVFALQDEIVGRIVRALSGLVPPVQLMARPRATNLEAYDLFVRGRALVNQSVEGNRAGRQLLERSIALDSDFAEAYVWLAMGHLCGRVMWGEVAEPHFALALSAAERAVSLDPDNAGAHAVLGDVLLFHDRPAGVAELATALALNPNHADAWVFLGEARAYEGDAAAGIAHTVKAFSLNPYPPGWYYWYLGYVEYAAGHYEDAMTTLWHPSTHRLGSQRILAASLAQLGRAEEARAEAQQFLAAHPQFSIQSWASAQPFQHEADRQSFIDGYLKAGLPM
ncbi:winged helix-turn-helix domain-containing tetratricopeptide repeat protein [Microvirga tunisiensis]|uniref:Adenylate cyclase n=1 Tax=Microvirga tunisiensis TaxID=2108360 RepID=A0A5N7MT81_9HYPH|nr:winged helix-turn-helix domain-containing protein [Microvirga tunisiensis]MPR11903.1 adenylate cyclase [Microvirga tunisiensis]MPR29860.1 adenylate cyclase [Microvirga tunisiensis]